MNSLATGRAVPNFVATAGLPLGDTRRLLALDDELLAGRTSEPLVLTHLDPHVVRDLGRLLRRHARPGVLIDFEAGRTAVRGAATVLEMRAFAAILVRRFSGKTGASYLETVGLADARPFPFVEIGTIGAGRPLALTVHREKAGVGGAARRQKSARTDSEPRCRDVFHAPRS